MSKKIKVPVFKAPDYPETYGDLIDWAIKKVKDPEKKVFYRMSGTDIALTYAEFGRKINKVANMLLDLGVKKDDHIGIFLGNCVEYAYLVHALGKIGAVIVPVNQFIRGEALRYTIDHSDAKYLITASEVFNDKISPIIDSLKKLKCVLFTDKVVELKKIKTVAFADFEKYPSDFEAKWKVTGDDIEGIWYTSGTTGLPKGTVVTQRTYLYRAQFVADYFRVTPEDISYFILPCYHAAWVTLGPSLALAAKASIIHVPWFSASAFWDDVVKYKGTLTFSTGTIIPILLKQPVTESEIKGREQLRLWLGWPVDDPKSVKARWPKIRFMQGYGCTEGVIATMTDYDNPEFGNAGKVTVYTDMKIIDSATGKEKPTGEPGEIIYAHKLGTDNYMLKGYYKDPEKTKETIIDGYWHSGDVGLLDKDGNLHFTDRIKDYLRIGGENVSSAVVEDAIRKYPDVAEVAFTGAKGDLGHDVGVAHVVPREGATIDPKAFFEFCNKTMSYFMVPRYLVIRKELPKTATLRIEKYKLREEGIPENAIDREKLGIKIKR